VIVISAIAVCGLVGRILLTRGASAPPARSAVEHA
jgi:hypothetical protein